MRRRALITALACAIVSCTRGDARPPLDSVLARDLAQANQNAAEPQFKDTALSPEAVRAAPTPQRPTRQQPARQRPASQPTASPVEVPAAPQPSSAPVDAPAAPKFRGIPAGTTIALTTKGQVCTTNLPGDKITATVSSDVVGENGAVIPAGATVVLEVAQVTPGDKPEDAALTLRIRSVIVNDQPVSVPSDVAVTSELERHTLPRDKGADRKKVIGGVVAGAIVGQILGKNTKSTVTGAVVGGAAGAAAAAATGTKYDACLPAGGTVRATTREPVPMTTTQ